MYNIEKRIGRKVWVFEETTRYNYRLNQEKEYVVKSIAEPDKDNWDYMLTLVCGEERLVVPCHKTIVVPEKHDDEICYIMNYLTANGFYFEEVYEEDMVAKLIRISISWGDWKHDHMWLDNLMSYIGYEEFNTIVTEENGSDCYSADHIYVRKDDEKYEMLNAMRQIFSN